MNEEIKSINEEIRSIMEKTRNCFKCKHYYITWDGRFPNGCRIYGIKTKYNPSAEVLKATGKECFGFEEKPVKNKH
nr:uracil-DNA glycosylase [Desulfotruncus alcoholivorax]